MFVFLQINRHFLFDFLQETRIPLELSHVVVFLLVDLFNLLNNLIEEFFLDVGF